MAFDDWSQTAGSNLDVGGVSIAEGMSPAGVNNAMRGLMSEVAIWRDLVGGKVVSAGTANAQTITTVMGMAAYAQGILIGFEAGAALTNTGAMTIAVDGLTAKSVKLNTGADPDAGAITAGGIYLIAYEATSNTLLLLNPAGTSLDADLTTIAGLTATTDNFMQAKSSAWASRTVAQVLTDLAVPGTTFQPLDADLTTIAGLTATSDNFIQSKSSAWASRTVAQVLVDLAAPGTTFQPLDSDLTTIAGLTATSDNFLVSVSSAWASRTPAQALTTLLANDASATGTLVHERGGLEADVSAYDGLTRITGGATSAITYIPSTSWTPTVAFGGASTGITYSTQAGTYSQIGDTVYFSCRIVLSNDGSATGDLTIEGLIVTAASNSIAAYPVAIRSTSFTGLTGALYAYVGTGASPAITIKQWSSVGTNITTDQSFATNTLQIHVVGTYRA